MTDGRIDPVRIEIPKGKYIPKCSVVENEETKPEASVRTGVEQSLVEETRTRQPDSEHGHNKNRTKQIARLALAVIAILAFVIFPINSRVSANTFDDAALLPRGPSLTVLPFEILGGESVDRENIDIRNLRIGIYHEIVGNLCRFKNLFVKGLSEDGDALPIDSARSQNTQYFLTGTIQRLGNEIRIHSMLKRASTGEVIWTHAYDEEIAGAQTFLHIQSNIAVEVAGALGQANSIIHNKFTAELSKLNDMQLDHYYCLMGFYGYMNSKTVEKHLVVRACLEKATDQMPKFSSGWSALAQIYADEDFNRFNPRQMELSPAERAHEAALKAVAADSDNAMAYQYLAMSKFLINDEPGFRDAAEMTLKLNPNYADGLAMVGMYLIRLDNSEQGRALVEKAIVMNPASPSWYHGAITLFFYLRNDTDSALYHARQFHQNGSLPAHTMYVVTLVQDGQIEEARKVFKTLVEKFPFFPTQYPGIFARRRLPDGAYAQMVGDLEIAGLEPVTAQQ